MIRPLLLVLLALPAGPQVQLLAQVAAPQLAPLAQAKENALKYLQAARTAYKPHEQGAEPTPEEARRIIEENAAVFPLLEAALKAPLRYDELLFEPVAGAPNGVAPMRLYDFVRLAARLLILRSGVQARDGDIGGALESSLQSVALGFKVQEDGPLMSALVGYSIESLGARSLQQLAPKLSPAQLKAGARRLLELEAARISIGQVLAGEREVSLRAMGAALAQGHGPETGFGRERQAAALDVLRETFESEDELLARPFALLRGLDFTWREDEAGQPAGEAAEPARPLPRFNANTWAQSMLKVQRPVKGRALFARARTQAQLSLLATAMAARAYTIETAKAPASLQVLVPEFLPALPLDSFELDAPLQLKSDAEGVRIYSIGPDGLDDDGRLNAERGPNLDIDSAGDLLAPPELLKP